MSAEAKNVRLDGPVLAALQEAAARRHKTLDEMASEAVMEGLKAERLNDRYKALTMVIEKGPPSLPGWP